MDDKLGSLLGSGTVVMGGEETGRRRRRHAGEETIHRIVSLSGGGKGEV